MFGKYRRGEIRDSVAVAGISRGKALPGDAPYVGLQEGIPELPE
jgi:hypothetical protein